jgi:hypothetical protein
MKTRRQFLQSTSTALAGAALSPLLYHQAKAGISANDTIGVALMGCRGMGNYNLKDHLLIPEIE